MSLTAAQSTIHHINHLKARKKLALLALLLATLFLLSLFLGRYPTPGFLSLQRLANDPIAQTLVLNLRLPRALTAILLGMSLGAAGAVFQLIFNNPLVEPGFLGVSQGAAFGAALGIILGGSAWLVQSLAVVFAFHGLGGSPILAQRARFGGWVLRLVLAGIVISAVFSSGLGVLKYIADPLSQLPEITFWLLGGLWSITWAEVRSIVLLVLIGLVIMLRMRWRLNILALEDEVAFSLGVAPARERALILLSATAVTAAVVSVSGIVSWVGLIVPHIARRMFGADARFSLPGAALIGGCFVLVCDNLARTLMTGEIPLGIMTALLGATLFGWLMTRRSIKVR